MAENEFVVVDDPAPHVARITIRRPEKRNALDVNTTRALDRALIAASRDQQVKVIVLAAEGRDFCSGHDLSDQWRASDEDSSLTGLAPLVAKGIDGFSAFERELFFELPEKWRNLPTPTIAVVQGRCIAGGLAVALACDVIISGEGTTFVDPTVALGACGPEHFAYPWDLGTRAAKYLLFTGDALSAKDALRMGLVSKVHPDDELMSGAIQLAIRVAAKPAFALRMTKEAINLAADISGRRAAMQAMFPLHQLCHAENFLRFGLPVDPGALTPDMANAVRSFVEANGILPHEVKG